MVRANAVFAGLLFLVGCQDSRFLANTRTTSSKPVEVPDVSEATHATHARVDQVGRTILRTNLFIGIEPSFHTIGHKDPLLFHRDENGLFISDTLVNRCQTDGELAAVLCTELGKMVAEKRNVQRMGLPEPPLNVPISNSMEAGGIPADQIFVAEAALREQKSKKDRTPASRNLTTDPKKIARELLKTAGYDESEMKSVEANLRHMTQDSGVQQQLGGAGAPPRWSP